MNKTYRIIGLFWDNLKISDEILFMDDIDYINDISEYPNLFDDCGIRKINISTILKIENPDEIDNLINKTKNYKSILINIDYVPNNNKIVIAFYKKRISQIYNYFSKQNPNTYFYLSYNYMSI